MGLHVKVETRPPDPVFQLESGQFNASIDEMPEVRATERSPEGAAGDALLTAQSFGGISLPDRFRAPGVGIQTIGRAAIAGEIPDVVVQVRRE